MTPEVGEGLTLLAWGNAHLAVHISAGPDDVPRIAGLALPGDPEPTLRRSALPLVDVALAGEGRMGTAGKRHVDGAAAHRLRLIREKHGNGPVPGEREGRAPVSGPWWQLVMQDAQTGLEVLATLSLPGDGPVLRIATTITAGDAPVVVEHVSSLALGGLAAGAQWEDEAAVWHAANPWSGEFRWLRATLAERGLVDVGMTRFNQLGSKNRVALTSTGAWSTGEHLPMGVLEDIRTGKLLAWQIETNGAWHWEVADRYDDLYVVASGPTALEHAWTAKLAPGESFHAAPASVTLVQSPRHERAQGLAARVGDDGGASALGAALTTYRRAVRREHPDNVQLPIIYNDFLNGLMSDPTTERVLPLVEAASDLGADIYCMDAGWYDDENGGWWDSVGEWKAAASRFPGGGLAAVMRTVHDSGMRPGLWLEPEVVGRRSPLANVLPPEAFFRRHGHRVSEWGRYQLDLRHPAARAHLDDVVDRVVGEYGLGYLKLDYNVDTGAGTSGPSGMEPFGNGLLGHSRAMLDWAAEVMDRYPGLIIEGCAAGGSRTDAASGSVFPVQSLTDQQDMLLLPPISAAAPLAITPEQSGVWASIDGSMGDEMIAFALAAPLAARFHLGGRIDTLSSVQRAIVRSALVAYGGLRTTIARGLPLWPLGLPGWRDEWIVQGTATPSETLVVVHRRGGEEALSIPLPGVGVGAGLETIFPAWGAGDAVLAHRNSTAVLDVTIAEAPAARVFRITEPIGGLGL
ncbi:glycoside hydrolase family 36 protein [Arthrobacter sp. CJ23]|uniref:glycoside hydrolase family 36 protein n=1 Tax=Arthrobacter sp. CJ23 TaxID=2972479 RepID=UPI00215D142B|nr:glycoside hydrolase family 36 protein [Arthrobacter sp. CJ23]UVJ41680.1 alpha-galactosidase [Arthrobacter sp. CJ23]